MLRLGLLSFLKPTLSNCLNSSACSVGQPAGGVATCLPGFFETSCRGLLGTARIGARTAATTYKNKTPCAPIENFRTVLGQGRKCSFADPMLHECHAEGDAVCRHKPKGVGGRQINISRSLKEWRDAQ
ncbi:hypothetical protein [Cognatishimia sp. MH4019]|uniref:hypothetical protein n=1 Tax=Cognatishimia sp. MH4019 TaxID=2854030 RepID=UPI001CD2FC90|nr:hypothetical protein [Cognatishimia sp. MH4019]